MSAWSSERLDALEAKVDVLIERVETIDLRLTAFQTETRSEFATVRQEIREGDEETRRHTFAG
jgi:hypothetical protein